MFLDYYSVKKVWKPLLVSVPHSGTEIPQGSQSLKELSSLPREIQLRDVDLFVDELFSFIPSLDIPMLATRISRYVIDLNRGPMEIDAGSVAGEKNPPASFRRGLIWHITTRGEKLLNAPLSQDDFKTRFNNYYKPYHDNLREELNKIKRQFGYVILLDAHSMPSQGTPEHRDPGEKRADVVPGTQFGRSSGPKVEGMVKDFFATKGYQVRLNHPYRGGYITQFYGSPENGVYAFQLELNRRLYMDEEKFIKINSFDKLRDNLVEFVKCLAEFKP